MVSYHNDIVDIFSCAEVFRPVHFDVTVFDSQQSDCRIVFDEVLDQHLFLFAALVQPIREDCCGLLVYDAQALQPCFL